MSEPAQPEVGSITWRDLTVDDTSALRAFYGQVVGWKFTPHSMGEYDDYNVHAPGSDVVVGGICHARGPNAGMPAQWIIYITVADADASAAACVELGGELVDGPRDMGGYRFCVIRDPAGAVAGLISKPT